ncbi:peptidase family M3 [Colletotrichum orchidophilum]|uniref:Peptidase family M3 n=1 Tax=Colletotrichum orchidophilum TaxID=1209926 RepID=A0A1G4BKQ6_9PEZI|nr:peptidase family M3 [Colletotrichum orchidophilum]OHF02031.1 peptidase family M3 [Colletotrichum orchidophilum]
MSLQQPLQPPQAPPLFTATPTSVLQATERLIQHLRLVQSQIIDQIRSDNATFANVILPLVHAENSLAREAHVLIFFKSVSPDLELRDASRKAQTLLDDFMVETAMDKAMFRLIDAVLRKNEDLDPESLRLLKKKHSERVRNGLNLPPGPQRERFAEIKSQLSRLTVEFRENLDDADGGMWLTPEELDGLPENVVSQLENGQGENKGKLLVSFGPPSFYPTLRFLKRADVRRRFHIAGHNECNQNVAIFREIVVLRDEAARLLGYPSHAAFRLEEKMAKTPEIVNAFLDDLRLRLAAGGQQETEALRQLKKRDVESRGESFDGRFFDWDFSYYKRVMLETQYSVDQHKIAEYFPLQATISGMLSMFEKLFGLVFHESAKVLSGNGQEYVWHEDVQLFSVWDDAKQGGGFVGYLYLDLFPRDGKNRSPANFNVIPGFSREDGTRQYPATAMVCSFAKPTPQSPSLLRHDELVTLFHELGHGIHDLVSKTTYACFHGTETALDFGEAPSQMLENWCWVPSQLKALSKHYSSLSPEYLQFWQSNSNGGQIPPPEQMPDDMIESLTRSRYVNGALFHLNQLSICIFDMAVHNPESHAAIEKMNISAMYNRIHSEIYPPDGPEAVGHGDEWGHNYVRFGHLVNDYDAGYYSYLFSKVYSADMFHTVFKADSMDAEEGRRYRYAVLEKGGKQDEMKTLTEFLGRQPKTDAFQLELGLA